MHETKVSATPATSGGVITGSTIRATVAGARAPDARAASTSSLGSARRPARNDRNTSGAKCVPSSSTMPSREYSGFGLPSDGDRPSIFNMTLDGPNTWSQLSAAICGGIISGSTNANTSGPFARMSVKVNSSAAAAPINVASRVPATPTSRLCRVARQVAGSLTTSRSAGGRRCSATCCAGVLICPRYHPAAPATAETATMAAARSPTTFRRPRAKGGLSAA
jgi:hypothetical protein